jgi:hypothetical protein
MPRSPERVLAEASCIVDQLALAERALAEASYIVDQLAQAKTGKIKFRDIEMPGTRKKLRDCNAAELEMISDEYIRVARRVSRLERERMKPKS